MKGSRWVWGLLLVGLGCSSPPSKSLPVGCQPLLDGADCLLPYPSDFFRVEDASLPSGFRIVTEDVAALETHDGVADLNDWRPLDGFSRLPVIVGMLPGPVSDAGMVGIFGDYDTSTVATSRTLLLDANSGTPIPHFVDVDPRADDPFRQAIVLHPLVSLQENTRYVVALQGVTDDLGVPSPAAGGFAALRDGRGGDRQDHYDTSIFPVLDSFGVARGDLQLAWDFTTGTDTHVVGDMLRVRELTLDWLGQNTPTIAITSVDEDLSPQIWRTIRGTVTGPLFTETDAPGASLFRDGAGQVAQNGTTTFGFLAQVPVSVRDQFGPGDTVGFGHSLFGDVEDARGPDRQAIVDGAGLVMFAIDTTGLSGDDLPVVTTALSSAPAETAQFSERVHQAVVNWLVTSAAIRGPLAGDAAFSRPASGPGTGTDGNGNSNAGDLLYDNTTQGFLGISGGAMLGGVLAPMSPDFERVCLQVGGAGWTHMMMRSVTFDLFLQILSNSGVEDPLDQQKFAALLTGQLDRIDPGIYARYLLAEPLAGSPPDRRVLLMTALGDTSVPNFASFLSARLVGVEQITPAPVPIYGVSTTASPASGSAIEVYDFGIDTSFYEEAVKPDATTVHFDLADVPAAIAQIDALLTAGGEIVRTCSGACDPE